MTVLQRDITDPGRVYCSSSEGPYAPSLEADGTGNNLPASFVAAVYSPSKMRFGLTSDSKVEMMHACPSPCLSFLKRKAWYAQTQGRRFYCRVPKRLLRKRIRGDTYLVCLIIHAIFCVERALPAMMRSPSFSRPSSSMTTTNSPRPKASMASSMGSNANSVRNGASETSCGREEEAVAGMRGKSVGDAETPFILRLVDAD